MRMKLLASSLTLALALTAQSALATTFHTFLNEPVHNLDPLYLKTDASRQLGHLVHRGLVSYSPTLMPPRYGAHHQVVPAIAGSWEIGPDKKTYIFTLDEDARFHNGRQVRAADVKYSIERAANPNLNAHNYWAVERLNIKGLKRYQAAHRAGIKEPHLLGVEVIDHNMVMIQLENPIPYALELLALPLFSVLPREDVERWWKDFRKNPVGAGPYSIGELKPESRELELKRFEGFYDTTAQHTETLNFTVMPRHKEQFMAFTRKQLDHTPLPMAFFRDVLDDPKWNPLGERKVMDAKSLNKLSDSRVVKVPSWSTHYLNMDNSILPFQDVKVRQAFNYAVNKYDMIQHQLQSYAQPVAGVFPPGFPGATRHNPLYVQDADKARKLLFEAGWRDRDRDGDIEPWQNPHLDLTLHYQDNEMSYLICRQVQADLAHVGVNIQIAPIQNYLAQRGTLPPFFHAVSRPEIIDPSQLFYPNFYSQTPNVMGGRNFSMYSNPRVDELLAKAEDLAYEPRRYDLYAEAERYIVEDAPWLFLFHPVDYYLVQPHVSQYVVHPALPFPYETYALTVKTAER